LPEQQFAAASDANTVQWVVSDGDAERTVSKQLWYQGKVKHTDAHEFLVDHPATEYRVRLVIGDSVVKEWILPGLTESLPLLAFRVGGQMRAYVSGIPRDVVWLLVPRDSEVMAVEAETRAAPLIIRETAPALFGTWSPFELQQVDLRGIIRLELNRQGSETVPLPLITPYQEPSLVGASVLPNQGEGDDEGVPVYADPPALCVPLDPNEPAAAQLKRGSLTFRSSRDAQPQMDIIENLAGLAPPVSDGADHVDLLLATWLGALPAGEFELQVRSGSLGGDTRLRFAVVPGLEVQGHDRLMLPSATGQPQPATLTLWCHTDGRLLADDKRVTVKEELAKTGDVARQKWQAKAEATAEDVALRFERPGVSHGKASLTFRVPLRRLHWRLDGLGDSMALASAQVPILRDDFLEASNPALVVQVPPSAPDLADLHLVLGTAGGDEKQELRPPHGWRPGLGTSVRFDLRAFGDTIRHATEPELTLLLEVELVTGSPPPFRRFTVLAVQCSSHSSPALPEMAVVPERETETGTAPPVTTPSGDSPTLPVEHDESERITDQQSPRRQDRSPRIHRPEAHIRRDPAAPIPAQITWRPPPEALIGRPIADIPKPNSLCQYSQTDLRLYLLVNGERYDIECPFCHGSRSSKSAPPYAAHTVGRFSPAGAATVLFECWHKADSEMVLVGRWLGRDKR
jgi:hypothetical protein